MKNKIRLLCALIPAAFVLLTSIYRTDAADGESVHIQKFEDIEYNDMFVYPEPGLSESETSEYLPKYLRAFTDSGEITDVPVKWECLGGNFDNTDFYCYQFSPVWDYEKYVYDDVEDIAKDGPYIFVCYGEKLIYDNGLSSAGEDTQKNADRIMTYFTDTLGLSTTAACGMVANIYFESGCTADILEYGYTWKSGGGYGICQWTNTPRTSGTGRRTNLVNYCKLVGANYKSLSGQLKYLGYELTTGYASVLNSLKDVDISSSPEDDCYNAAYIWCTKFEIPADAQNAAIVRGNYAKQLWKSYGAEPVSVRAPKLTGNVYPDTLTKGSGYPVKGIISKTASNIKKVKIALTDVSGNTVCSKSVYTDADTYDISNLDSYIAFDKLNCGRYFYKIIVTTTDDTYTLLKKDFLVSPQKPGKVKNVRQTAKSSATVTLSWKNMAGVTGYKIMRSESPDGAFKTVANIKEYTTVTYTDKNLTKYTQYYYKIRAYVTTGGVTNYGSYSDVVIGRTNSYSQTTSKILKKSTALRTNPGSKYDRILTIKEGKKVRLINRTADSSGRRWYYVKYATKYGYIRTDMFK